MRVQRVPGGYSFWFGDGKQINKSISVGWYWTWLLKPRTWLACYTNGARKGIDKCFDFNLHIFCSCFCYTDWNYSRFINQRT